MRHLAFVFAGIFTALIVAQRAAATGRVRLDCTELGDGGLGRVQILEDNDGSLTLKETGDNGVETGTPLAIDAFARREIPLSPYYEYTRTLTKATDGRWYVRWSCGQSFDASCVESEFAATN